MIKAIDTFYAGRLFRSRLEARWAVFLDALGRDWDYEREGYALPGGWYLPDFWLPIEHPQHANAGYFLEIKGQPPTDEEVKRCEELTDATKHQCILIYGTPVDGEFVTMKTRLSPSGKTVLSAAGFPMGQPWEYSSFSYVWHASKRDHDESKPHLWKLIPKALVAASSARFEQGFVRQPAL